MPRTAGGAHLAGTIMTPERAIVGPRTALLIMLLLAILHTWPLATAPAGLSLHQNADAEMNAWALGWIARAVVHDPVHLFDGNIFAPEPRTLAYIDPTIVPALVVAPVSWLGGSPVLAYNLSLIAGLTLTAWAGWLAARHWSGSASAALVGGALVAFNAHLLTRLPHIVAAHLWGVPLALLAGRLVLDDPRRRQTIGLGLVVAATAATSPYSLALVGLVVCLLLAAGAVLRRWRAVAALGIASAAGLTLALPVLWPYLQLAATGVDRPISSVAQFSATAGGYLTSVSHVHAGWSAMFFRDDVNVLFAGVTALVLAGIGIVAASDSRCRHSRSRCSRGPWFDSILLVLLGLTGVWLSLGPATALYRALYEWVPPLRGLRAAARFGYLYLVAVAIAAAIGTAVLERRARSRSGRAVLAGVLLALVTIEAWSGPIETRPFTRVPPIYTHLPAAPVPVLLVEVPFYPPEAFWGNTEYMLNSTAHWRPLMNGYGGFIPDSYRRRAASFWFFPEDWAIDAILDEGATHLMVHLEKFTPAEADAIERAMRRRSEFVLIASDTLGHRLYRVSH